MNIHPASHANIQGSNLTLPSLSNSVNFAQESTLEVPPSLSISTPTSHHLDPVMASYGVLPPAQYSRDSSPQGPHPSQSRSCHARSHSAKPACGKKKRMHDPQCGLPGLLAPTTPAAPCPPEPCLPAPFTHAHSLSLNFSLPCPCLASSCLIRDAASTHTPNLGTSISLSHNTLQVYPQILT